jgi:hypothetical protein
MTIEMHPQHSSRDDQEPTMADFYPEQKIHFEERREQLEADDFEKIPQEIRVLVNLDKVGDFHSCIVTYMADGMISYKMYFEDSKTKDGAYVIVEKKDRNAAPHWVS